MKQPVTLTSVQQIPSKPFADPHHTTTEHSVMLQLLQIAQQLSSAASMRSDPVARMVSYTPEQNAWSQRLILVRPLALLQSESAFVVGFFGQKNLSIDYRLHMKLAQMDEEFLDSLDAQPHLLAYCTTMLPDNINFANIVLFSHRNGVAAWSESQLHMRVVAEMAPICYESIRLYNGLWHPPTHTLKLSCVKYFDYLSQPGWRAVRPIGIEA